MSKPERDERTGRSAAAARMAQQQSWVDQQVRIAMEKGEFDNLPGAGKPIKGLGATHDPDWWLKKLVEREQIALLPASLQLRKDDADLDAHLDELFNEAEVRREVEDFNARVMRARYSPQDGLPPLVTMPREVDETLAAWRERRAARRARPVAAPPEANPTSSPTSSPTSNPESGPRRRRWWGRRR